MFEDTLLLCVAHIRYFKGFKLMSIILEIYGKTFILFYNIAMFKLSFRFFLTALSAFPIKSTPGSKNGCNKLICFIFDKETCAHLYNDNISIHIFNIVKNVLSNAWSDICREM